MLFVCDALETASCFRTLSLSLSLSLPGRVGEFMSAALERKRGKRGGNGEKKLKKRFLALPAGRPRFPRGVASRGARCVCMCTASILGHGAADDDLVDGLCGERRREIKV